MDRHNGFSVGDRVIWKNPMGIDRHLGTVVRLARNGYLTVCEDEFQTTVDVYHADCELIAD